MDLDRWEHKSDWPLISAALVFAGAYAWQVLGRPVGAAGRLAQMLVWGTWALFVIDYVVRLWLAPHRGRWFVRHLFDLATVALPMLRPLRLLRLLTVLSVLNRAVGTAMRGRVAVYVAGSTAVLVLISALAMLDAERSAGGDITTYGKALWWAIVTITTVGYGDLTPVTTTGRLVAAGTMLCGIALLGTVTATLASWLVQRISEEDAASAQVTRDQVQELVTEIRELRGLVEQSGAMYPASGDAGAG